MFIHGGNRSKPLLITGIVFNLGLLSYYKYTDFLIGTLNTLGDASIPMQSIVLPLAISFFTFQQIAYLADSIEAEPVNGISCVIACSCGFSHSSSPGPSSATVKYFPS